MLKIFEWLSSKWIWILTLFVVWLVFCVFLLGLNVGRTHAEEAKPLDLAITGQLGYDYGSWGSGQLPEVGGTHHDESLTRGASVQIIYNKKVPLLEEWKLRPMFDFEFKYEPFRFDTRQAEIQRDNVDSFSFRLGVTKDLGPFDGYLTLGYTSAVNNVRLIETYPELNHGKPMPTANLFSMKMGVFKMWEIPVSSFGSKIKVGPEISMEVYPQPDNFSRCRRFHSWPITPQTGLRIQW